MAADPLDPPDDPDMPADLARLAAAHGVATQYLDADDVAHHPPTSTIRAVLRAMEVPCADAHQVAASLRDAEEAPWRRLVAPTVVVRGDGDRMATVALPDGEGDVHVEMTEQPVAEAAQPVTLAPVRTGEHRVVDGVDRVRCRIDLPGDLPLGIHRLVVRAGEEEDTAHLLVVPTRCPVPDDRRRWGWQIQLYAMRSRSSWGIGDLADLTTLASDAGAAHGADFILLNPLHAATPVLPQEPSPYYPSSRRAWNPLYLRPEGCDGWQTATGGDRDRLEALRREGLALTDRALIDRDAVFTVKDEALRICAAQPLTPERQAAFDAYVAEGGEPLDGLVTAFALARRHGATLDEWPEDLRRPGAPAVAAEAADLADEIAYQRWLQWQADHQLADAQQAADAAGMDLGLMTDLAVGVDAQGADGWTLAGDLARDVTVGAPPDALAQRGQDWRLPPLRPDRLAATGYAAFRELVGQNLRHAGGIRIDHVMGLFRLFWIPEGAEASDGTYVYYDAEAMLGALALEAHRAGAVVVGEDLGTVEDGVRESMAERGVMGSAVFWFEQPAEGGDGEPQVEGGTAADAPVAEERSARIDEYRRLALTSVTTHDLPTVAGWAAGEPSRIRAATGQLTTTPEEDAARSAEERRTLIDLLVDERVLDGDQTEDPAAISRAIHTFVARTPSLLVGVGLADAVADLRQPNLPGTDQEVYPNWRLPIAVPDPAGDDVEGLLPPSRPVPLEDLLADPRVRALAQTLTEVRSG